MRKSTLLAISILLGIIASYRVEALYHRQIWQYLTGAEKPAKTITVTVTKEEYNFLLQKRRQIQKCSCELHVYGASGSQRALLLCP